jgi:hypothetical protein
MSWRDGKSKQSNPFQFQCIITKLIGCAIDTHMAAASSSSTLFINGHSKAHSLRYSLPSLDQTFCYLQNVPSWRTSLPVRTSPAPSLQPGTKTSLDFALASGATLTFANYFLVGWFNGDLDQFYMQSWNGTAPFRWSRCIIAS